MLSAVAALLATNVANGLRHPKSPNPKVRASEFSSREVQATFRVHFGAAPLICQIPTTA
jgi:hypothetical protein